MFTILNDEQFKNMFGNKINKYNYEISNFKTIYTGGYKPR